MSLAKIMREEEDARLARMLLEEEERIIQQVLEMSAREAAQLESQESTGM